MGLVQQDTVVLLVDLVESVRLMREHEASAVRRWTDFVQLATGQILPRYRGGLVKSLGDGLMARFESVRDAVNAAAEMHRSIAVQNTGRPEDQHFQLRAGINSSTAWSDGTDIYGTGINLAARLATLAGPGETIASEAAHEQLATALASLASPGETIGSAAARDELTHGVDALCEDLGDCILKHFDKPVRAYRVGPASPHPSLAARRDYGTPMEPTIAVIPFDARKDAEEHLDVGNLIADSVIWCLSRSANLKVISRLSTNIFRGRVSDVAEVSAHLGATYILSGSYVVDADRILVTAELSAARTNQVVWTDRLSGNIGDLLQPESELAHRIAAAVHLSVFDAEVEHILTQPLPTLESYSLLLGSIRLMHRSSREEFLQTRTVLEELINRHGRIAAPRAWLANWYILRMTRGWSEDRKREAAEALSATRAALDRDPSDALALATEGFVYCHMLKDLDAARKRCEQAVDANPSHALGWLYRGTVDAFKGDGEAAVDATRRALKLSPLDPQRYYFESLGATALLSAHRYDEAEELARSSLILNRMHPSTWRVLAIALVSQGRVAEAREALGKMRELEPHLTLDRYIGRLPNADLETGRHWARCLEVAGLPTTG
ncbi:MULTISPECIES: adenylate/guanylate cyclase domain-containing protein [Bradyrhizobium]|uniref:adenylate/guanylate cyclase domain-containing protein n=2 Tax=Nitrobacteraceae TaxID=41294 RepID=UPI0004B98400|nr:MULTISPECIES: tetratricopeptide repeat protein [Bradyrhizobium]MCA1376259.1 tetratricopeptide repeat protein [Bradyrhizobium sp. IC4060]MCA1416320.1 tetratricopeptide repeat protein [Bradyrhizobium sp. NBAIM20]MCA1436624.1 tetratricopeptide repeat protein [Bradyrhizobium sp. BRP20]MCA1464586.1 tetratricopeptide repeat protein [Bradyrhizobium sp. NBAIM18]MCA1473768.1 tetratricopeptide repeat protein [Bradyrhizobium sp. NBAIM08]